MSGQTDPQKDKQTDRHTDMLIAVIRSVTEVEIITIRYNTIRYGIFTCAQKLTRGPA